MPIRNWGIETPAVKIGEKKTLLAQRYGGKEDTPFLMGYS